MDDIQLAKIGLAVENLPDCLLLIRISDGWEICQPDEEQGFEPIAEHSDLLVAVCMVSTSLQTMLKRLRQHRVEKINGWRNLGELVMRMTPKMALVRIESVGKWHVWLPSDSGDDIAQSAGVGNTPEQALLMALTPIISDDKV